MFNNIQKIALLTVIIVMAILWFQSCENLGAENSDLTAQLHSDSLAFRVEKAKDGGMIVKQKGMIINQAKTMKKLVTKVNGVNKEFAQLKASTRTESTNIAVEAIGETVTLLIHDTVDNTPRWFLRLPQSYGFEDNWRGVYYTIDTAGDSDVDRMWYVNKPLITFGYEKSKDLKASIRDRIKKKIASEMEIETLAKLSKFPINIFGKLTPVVAYQDANPYVQITSMQNLVFQPEKKWYQRKGLYFATGLIAGAYLATKL